MLSHEAEDEHTSLSSNGMPETPAIVAETDYP
jgi:hypothetical protein